MNDVMEEHRLGPNGGASLEHGWHSERRSSRSAAAMVFCMEYLWDNISWLDDKLRPLRGARRSAALASVPSL